jgi:alanine dehydrogenase
LWNLRLSCFEGHLEEAMRIGVPKEIKIHECRVGLVPSSVRELVHSGHQVFVEKSAGAGAGIGDEAYRQVGARIVDSAEEVFSAAEMPTTRTCARG